MANGADGSIIIDTGLDTTGFSKGSDKFKSAVSGLMNTVNNLGKQANSAFQGMTPSIRNVETVASNLEEAMSANVFTQYIGQAKAQITSLVGQMTKLGTTAESGFANEKQVEAYQKKLEETKATIDQLKERLAILGDQPVNSAAYDSLMEKAEAAEYKLNQLEKKQQAMSDNGVKKNSASWKRLETQIQAARATLDRYLTQIDNMEAHGSGTGTGRESTEYQELAAALQIAEQAYQQYSEAARQVAEQQSAAQEAAAQEAQRQEEAAEAARIADEKHAAFQARMQAVFGAVMRANGAILTLGKNLAVTGFSALGNGLKSLVGNLAQFTKQGKSASITSKGLLKSLTSLKTMLISRVKRTFISGMFKDFGAAINSLARYSSAFNASMSSMKNAAKGLSGNMAVAFSSLVNAVAPAITTIINLISQAITYLNAFFALISGRSTMTVAKKSTDDYAKSLKSAGGAAKDLKNQVFGFDELNKEKDDSSGGGGGAGAVQFEDVAIDSVLPKELMDYFQAIKDAIAAQDWEGVGGLLADGINYVVTALDGQILAIHDKATQFVEAIARIGNGLVYGLNWENIGKTVADGIMLALDMIRTALTTFDFNALGDGLARGVNGMFANINWANAAATFAAKWNALIHTLQGFVHGVDWVTIGQSISEAITSWFMTIDWDGLADTLATGINGIATTLEVAIEDTPWVDMGEILGEAVMSWADLVDWTGLGSLLSDGILALFEFVNGFASVMDWKSIGSHVGEIIDGFDIVGWAAQASELLSNWYQTVYGFIAGLFEGIDWVTLGTNLWNALITFVTGIDYAGVVSTLFEMLGAAIGGATALVVGLASAIGESIGQAFTSAKEYFSSYIEACGGDVVAGLLLGIGNAILGIGEWVVTNIFNPFIEGFKSAFGIASPSTVMQEMGGYIIEGLLNGIKEMWTTLKEWFDSAVEDIKTTLSNAWDSAKETAEKAWSDLKDGVTKTVDDMKTTISTTVDNIKTGLSEAWDSVKTTAETTWENVKTSVTTTVENLRTSVTTTVENIKTDLSNAWDSAKSTASTAWENLKSSVSTTFTNLKTSLSTTTNSIKTTLSSAWDSAKTTAQTKWTNMKTSIMSLYNDLKSSLAAVDFKSIGSNLVSGVKTGINNAWGTFKSWVTSKFKSIIDAAKGVFGIHSPSKVFAEIGEYLMKGLGIGVGDGENTAIKQVQKTAENIIDSVDSEGPLQLALDGTADGFDTVITKLSETARIFAAIAEALTSMGGLNVPGVASGSIIPYKARIADAGEFSEIAALQNELKSAANDQQETMEDMRDIVREIRNLLEQLHLVVDANSLVKAITALQRAEIRSYGEA